jgi:hypothetical protein
LNRFDFVSSAVAASVTTCIPYDIALGGHDEEPGTVWLTRAQVKFFTFDDQKDRDSGPKIHIYYNRQIVEDEQVGFSDRLGGDEWPKHTPNGPFEIAINRRLTKSQFATAWTVVDFVTSGSDEWHYDLHLKFHWSDGSTSWGFYNGLQSGTAFYNSKWLWIPMRLLDPNDGWSDGGWNIPYAASSLASSGSSAYGYKPGWKMSARRTYHVFMTKKKYQIQMKK